MASPTSSLSRRRPSVAPVNPSTLSKSVEIVSNDARRRVPWFTSEERDVLVLSTVMKVLLFPAYHSTDFEVHRNWLAITHSLPISKWYYDTTSEWTLDYPPFFAYFEYLLSWPAYFIDPAITTLSNLNYAAWSCIAYQRSTVILTELVLGAALLRFVRTSNDPSLQRIISASLFLHPGFIIVDHIHFQYNGFMFGIFLWSIIASKNGQLLTSGILFTVLLNFKHIYMYIAPAYFVFLLRAYCFSPNGGFLLQNFVKLGASVAGIFTVSLGPFLAMSQIPQLLSRLFPFTRGLNHAYWAANAWALVTAGDRVLLLWAKIRGANTAIDTSGVESTSRGLVGDTHFAILPNVEPKHTFIITILFQLLFLVKLWRKPDYKSFVHALTLCGYCSFMFGWHVHEKAVLLILVPLSLLVAEDYAHYRTFVIVSMAGIVGLFPLLFTPAEWFIKVGYTAVWFAVTLPGLARRVPRPTPSWIGEIVHRLEGMYIYGFVILQIVVTALNALLAWKSPNDSPLSKNSLSQMEFLPLLLTSVYCAVGITWAFLCLSWLYIKS
ncbi:glycosyltransferase family 57 protein [Dacryopinax primogenitus]|uniref:Alpha-1,3-glucosyltransferase n=1 Tax=Dacryopinax primogenitus (strain DJM 731) TaxID=1858805 RepID=M5GFF4_DACPD|nr:glycosyltransferase family 57 protein [Dacryopinax primogenitus]EJU06232.1 glycosyltransferase family 57 protein [Dacryopinax primogenitus]